MYSSLHASCPITTAALHAAGHTLAKSVVLLLFFNVAMHGSQMTLAVRPPSFFCLPIPSRSRPRSLDLHESDDATKVAISFVVTAGLEQVSGVTSPGTALGTGEKVNLPADTFGGTVLITFTLTNDQWIHVSEVRLGTPNIVENPFMWRLLYALNR